MGKFILAIGVVAVLIFALWAWMMKEGVMAHEFYHAHCCSDKDCGVVQGGKVYWTSEGWVAQKGTWIRGRDGRVLTVVSDWTISPKEVRDSPDGRTHLCIVGGMAKCLYRGAGG